jgi:hypothetical protein
MLLVVELLDVTKSEQLLIVVLMEGSLFERAQFDLLIYLFACRAGRKLSGHTFPIRMSIAVA